MCTMCVIFFLQEFFQCVQEFLKLEKIEFGGLQGRSLSELVAKIFTDFQELMNQLSGKTYDPLDPNNKVHVHIYYI